MNIPEDTRTWAEISLSAIRHNAGVVREKVGRVPEFLAVVKANAYGHGAEEVSKGIADLVDAFGVANVEEALPLARFGRDILLLSPCLPGERAEAVRNGFIATVSSAAEAEAFAKHGRTRLCFKVDTAMGRIGSWHEAALDELVKIAGLPRVQVQSVSSHLPVPDEDEEFTREQLSLFGSMAPKFREIVPGAKVHVLNSAGVLGFPEHAHDMVRPGLMLYGSASPSKYQNLLRPALTWKARILLIREVGAGRSVSYGRTFKTERPMRLATLPVGYADGFQRQLSGNGAQVLVGGKRCDVLGRVTMDLIVVDVTDVREAMTGDEAVLLGRQGDSEILAAEQADKAGTIAWDIFTGIKGRVRRMYR